MIYFDSQQQIHEKDEIEELTGKLSFQTIEKKLMHSVLENDKETIEKGKLPILGSSDACMYIRGGYKASFIIVNEGEGNKKPAHWHSMTDTYDKIDKKVLKDVIGVTLNFVKIVDDEYDE